MLLQVGYNSCLRRGTEVSGLLRICQRGIRMKAPPPGKPPILPPSKTKRYRVVHIPWMQPEHVQELLWRRIAYFDAVNSIRAVIKEEYKEEIKEQGVSTEEVDEFNRLIEENNRENERIMKIRSQIESDSLKQKQDELKTQLNEKLAKEQIQRDKLNKEVLEMIERSENFITEENMEQKIVEALENPVCFDFAVDRQGNIYEDTIAEAYNTKPPSLMEKRGNLFQAKSSAPLKRSATLERKEPIYQPKKYDPPKKVTLV